MYSYCGNNPVNYVDPTGHWPEGYGSYDFDWSKSQDFWVEQPTFLEFCGQCLGDQAQAEHEYLQWKAYVAAMDAFEFEFGLGGGIGASAKIAELLKINAIVKGDPWHVVCDDGEWQTGTSAKIALSAALIGDLLEAGYNLNTFKANDGEEVVIEEGGYGFLGLSAELYFVYGLEIKAGIDVNEFIDKLEEHRVEYYK